MSDQAPLFGELLLRLGLVQPHQIEEALALQALSGQRVGEALVSLGHVTREQLRGALLSALGLSPDPVERPKLGELLVKLKHVSREQVEDALDRQKVDGRRLGEILVDLGHCTFKQVYEALNLQQGKGEPERREPKGTKVVVVDDSPISLEVVLAIATLKH